MKRIYKSWVSACVIATAMMGCSEDSTSDATTGTTPAGTLAPTAPATTAPGTAPTSPTAAPSGADTGGPGAAAPIGAGMPTGTAGTVGNVPATPSDIGMPTAPAPDAMTPADSTDMAVPGPADPVAGTDGPMMTNSCGTAEQLDEEVGPGPFTATHIENGGPTGSSWVYYPEELGRDGCKHPIFNWGPGAGTGPSNYLDHLNHLASHGFVINSQPSSGTGEAEKASLEWLMAQNDKADSPFYQKLDTTKVVMGGHSMGALTTFAMADWEPLTHYILVCGGSFGAPAGAENIHGPTLILGGDTDSGTPNFEDDYEAIPTPVIFLIKSGTGHVPCARNNLTPWTAFMRWQLYGETQWKDAFFGDGEYCQAPWDSCESKGW